MNKFGRYVFGAFVLALATISEAQEHRADSSLEGLWQGITTFAPRVEPTFGSEVLEGSQMILRIRFSEDHIQVWTRRLDRENAPLAEVYKGKFRMEEHENGAILYVFESFPGRFSVGGSDGWIETWNIVLIKSGADRLDAQLIRAVNNYTPPSREAAEQSTSVWFLSARGAINRIN